MSQRLDITNFHVHELSSIGKVDRLDIFYRCVAQSDLPKLTIINPICPLRKEHLTLLYSTHTCNKLLSFPREAFSSRTGAVLNGEQLRDIAHNCYTDLTAQICEYSHYYYCGYCQYHYIWLYNNISPYYDQEACRMDVYRYLSITHFGEIDYNFYLYMSLLEIDRTYVAIDIHKQNRTVHYGGFTQAFLHYCTGIFMVSTNALTACFLHALC